MQNVARNCLNKKGTFFHCHQQIWKFLMVQSAILQKNTFHTMSAILSKSSLPASASDVDKIFQPFTGSPVSQIQLSQSLLPGAVSHVRSFQSPIISTNSPPDSQN